MYYSVLVCSDKSNPELKRWTKPWGQKSKEKDEEEKPDISKTKDQLVKPKQELVNEQTSENNQTNKEPVKSELSEKNTEKENSTRPKCEQVDESVDSDQTESLDETEGREDDSDCPVTETSRDKKAVLSAKSTPENSGPVINGKGRAELGEVKPQSTETQNSTQVPLDCKNIIVSSVTVCISSGY